MTDTLIVWGGLGLSAIIGQLGQEIGLPAPLQDFGSLGILGFVVWYTLTKINASQERMAAALIALERKIDGIKDTQDKVNKE